MSFLKYASDPSMREGNGRGPLHFGRTHIDGMPFRGTPVALKDEEFDTYTETVRDADVDVFDLSDPEQKKRLRSIIDNVANGVFRVLRYDHHWHTSADGKSSLLVYLMWFSAQKELAKHRAPADLFHAPGGF
jgi:hypothetical protein